MREAEFKSAIEGKSISNTYELDDDHEYGYMHHYKPKDECPHCSEYEYRYIILEKTAIISKHKFERKAYCHNCEYEDFVDSDPIKGSLEEIS